MRKTTLLLILLSTWSVFSQVVINELDADTQGIDTKEFVELKSDNPFFSLEGYVLAFFNGNPNAGDANRIYQSLDLSGLVTDANGLVVIGNNEVSPVPSMIISDNYIQNGPDAIAIYQGAISNYQPFKLATTENLIDALAYNNSGSQALALMDLLGLTTMYNENQYGQKDLHSIQRRNDGSYEVKLPTPGLPNEGGGVTFIGIEIFPQALEVHEGTSLSIDFKASEILVEPLEFTISLTYGAFDTSDFSGPLEVNIPAGTDIASIEIQILNDGIEEGDEELQISMLDLAVGYVAINNNIKVRVVDANYTQAAWGSPIAPTFGVVDSSQPDNYYESLNGKSGEELKTAIRDIVANPSIVRKHTYGDVTTILKDADQNPDNSSQVWLIYLEKGRSKLDFQMTASNVGTWNREHIFPQSRGKFSGGTPSWTTGIDEWESTDAFDLAAGHSDAHHIRAADGAENSARGNKSFGPGGYQGAVGNLGSWKGDVARSLFYMAIRYDALDVAGGFLPTSTSYKMGDLDALLEWHRNDPADDFEMNRNNVIYTWQYNRNPFIDNPTLAEYIWGNRIGEIWNSSLSVDNITFNSFELYPNPAINYISIKGDFEKAKVFIYDLMGKQVMVAQEYYPESVLNFSLMPGMYFVKVESGNGVEIKKMLVK